MKRKRPQNYTISTLAETLRERLNGVIVCLSHSWGGLEQVVAQDAKDLSAMGLNFRVMCLEGSPIQKRLKAESTVKLLPIHFRPRSFLDFKMRAELRGLLNEGVNLIHLHQTSFLGSVIPWLWRRPNLVLMATRHIMNNHDKRNMFHAAIYGRLDALVVMSQALKENVLATHALRERQLKIIHLGLDFDQFSHARVDATKQREAWGAHEKTVVVGLVGRIDPAKGQATFIKAAAGLLRNPSLADRLKFVIVGEETRGAESGYLDELKEMVRQFRISDQVIFAGHQENIAEVMAAFDIFVMPSRQEAFGLVAIEAMAMECPIVISKGGSSAEIIGQQEYGLAVHPEDPFDLQRQLRFLIENPKERKAMGRRARDHVRANYDRQARLQQTLELYERCMRRRGI